MKVTVNYYGQLKQITNKDSESCDLSEQTDLNQMLAGLASQYGDKFKDFVFDQAGEIRVSLMISVNDNVVDKKPAPCLKDGDEVSILTPIAGG